jgi:hypothetical protein
MSKKFKTAPVHLQYWCRTQVIDKIVHERKGIEWKQELADTLEKTMRHYFVVDKKGNYKVISGYEFEQHFNDKSVPLEERRPAPECEMTPEAGKAINEYIKKVHKI